MFASLFNVLSKVLSSTENVSCMLAPIYCPCIQPIPFWNKILCSLVPVYSHCILSMNVMCWPCVLWFCIQFSYTADSFECINCLGPKNLTRGSIWHLVNLPSRRVLYHPCTLPMNVMCLFPYTVPVYFQLKWHQCLQIHMHCDILPVPNTVRLTL